MKRKNIIYYGSKNIIEKPIFQYYLKMNINKVCDYGEGFYTTKDLNAAKEWSCKDGIIGIVNEYYIDDRTLNVIDISENSDDADILFWLAILIKNRINEFDKAFIETYKERFEFINKYLNYKDIDNADIIIGYRADDAYFKFPREFISGKLSFDSLKIAIKLGKLGKQYVLISKKAFEKIKFKKTIEVEDNYKEKYKFRINTAIREYEELSIDDIKNNKNKIFIEDLMEKTQNDSKHK